MKINPMTIGNIDILNTQSSTGAQSTEEVKIEQQEPSQTKYVPRTIRISPHRFSTSIMWNN